ncbi:MAG: N-formylglutamate amidohydrolase [Paracoccaceae bacterium]|nr:N-formylglutamate amidohydrolase [Paracoccaceae bacterium]
MTTDSYHLHSPETRNSPVVFASPHSGRAYSRAFLRQSTLNEHQIRSSEDAFVDLLFSNVPSHGAPLLCALTPRAFVDLNRSVDELDPAVIKNVVARQLNPRISSGLGVIPRVVANGRAIYSGKIDYDEAEIRLANHWHPYHAKLRTLMDEAHNDFGQAILVDLHSMPHEALEATTSDINKRPEIVLGDRFGSAASDEIVSKIEHAFKDAGLRVVRNSPFAGAYVTQRYGRPSRNQHAVQIEIDRALYMDEPTITPRADFTQFRDLMTGVISQIVSSTQPNKSLAAE